MSGDKAAVCGWGSVIVGLVAAGLWIWSACVDLPTTPGAAIGGTSPDNLFNVALHKAAHLNAWAAFLTGLSVILAALERCFRLRKSEPKKPPDNQA